MQVLGKFAAVTTVALGSAALGSAATAAPPTAQGVPSVASAACTPSQVLARMSLEQQVGQMFMVGTPATGANATALGLITSRHIGNIMLTGRSTGGTAVPARTVAAFKAKVNSASTSSVPLLVATDQEGGYVQVLQGSGIDRMPTALTQGTWPSATLRSSAARWGGQLRAAGVNMNLAPVADTVPQGRYNPPIGYYDREYGYNTDRVGRAVVDILNGQEFQGHVAVTGKHFPGLGLVSANTDTTATVVDNSISKTSGYVTPFKQLINAGVPTIMMSSAFYNKIDSSRQAVFSGPVMSWLRSLGFQGVIMTDDFGNAKSATRWSYAARGTVSINNGVDLILSVNPAAVAPMYDAALAKARTDGGFRAKVTAAAQRVLAMKQRFGLMPTC
ncbi:glycoside hydrolase family 3 N-terminal domain-containing protein [Flexivirga meconopsidis]|uniref:glycoside hydrolase family 3 N-terminal domain-containing protein n=1 Tax=Flexivirga meconopsidis TaxID=2977121 RepID=UPI00223EC8DF|nr:glycoside hydrolase family 3 N-terminal domain-containing protein [Flexivirga meconopsidis]